MMWETKKETRYCLLETAAIAPRRRRGEHGIGPAEMGRPDRG